MTEEEFRDRLNALILETIESVGAENVVKWLQHYANLMRATLDRPED
jgi:hypothetical protein